VEQSLQAIVRRDIAVWLGWRHVADRLAAEDSLLDAAETGLRARFAAGQARYVDVLRLRTERLRVRSERAEAIRSGQEGKRRLLGMLPDDTLRQGVATLLDAMAMQPLPAWAESLPPAPDVDSLITALGADRLGDLHVDGARGRADQVRASRRPRLTGALGIQRFGDPRSGFTVGPMLRGSVSLPFAVGGSTRRLTQAADLGVAQAQAERVAFAARLRTALLLAHDRYAAARERLQVYDAALLTGAREEREGALGAYRTGELSLIELLDFERALARAETDGLRAAIDARIAYADLVTRATSVAGPDAGPSDSEAAHE
jgi:cobalt-zinc-cadmium efflux system outer membrane protein